MVSVKKFKKMKNSYCWHGVLKLKNGEKLKRIFFFTPSMRRQNNRITETNDE